MARLFSSFPFSHLLELARVGDPLRRGFYELGCIKWGGGMGTETPENQHGLWCVALSKDQECRWSHFKNLTPPEEMLKPVRDRVVPQPVPNFRFG